MALVASPNEDPGARLNDRVTTGNCPWWFTASAVLTDCMRVNAEIGTGAPLVVTAAPLAVGAPSSQSPRSAGCRCRSDLPGPVRSWAAPRGPHGTDLTA